MKKEQGHVFLKKLGKTRLRPGGITGTNFLLNHIIFKEGTTVLEVACNRGVNLLELAKNNPKVAFVGLDVDKESIEQATKEQEKLGLTNVTFIKGDAFHLKFEDNSFDYVINEAMLTMLSPKSKERALEQYYRVLKKDGLLLTHDIALISDIEETRKTLSGAINVNVFPMPKVEWEQLFAKQGFETQDSLQGKLTLMTPQGMLKDEGLVNTLRIVKNGLKPENREQFLKMRSTFTKLQEKMNYICIVNKK